MKIKSLRVNTPQLYCNMGYLTKQMSVCKKKKVV